MAGIAKEGRGSGNWAHTANSRLGCCHRIRTACGRSAGLRFCCAAGYREWSHPDASDRDFAFAPGTCLAHRSQSAGLTPPQQPIRGERSHPTRNRSGRASGRVQFKSRVQPAGILFRTRQPVQSQVPASGHMVRVTSSADSATMAMVWSMSSRLWAREKNSGWLGGR